MPPCSRHYVQRSFCPLLLQLVLFSTYKKCEGAESVQAQVTEFRKLRINLYTGVWFQTCVIWIFLSIVAGKLLLLFSQSEFSPCDVAQMFLDRGTHDIPNGQGVLPAVGVAMRSKSNVHLLHLFVDHSFSLGMDNMHALPMALFMKFWGLTLITVQFYVQEAWSSWSQTKKSKLWSEFPCWIVHPQYTMQFALVWKRKVSSWQPSSFHLHHYYRYYQWCFMVKMVQEKQLFSFGYHVH